MKAYARRLFSVLALLAGALVVAYAASIVLEITDEVLERLGPWSLVIVGIVTVALAAVWVRYGATGALARWGVTIKPADPLPSESDDAARDASADADLGGTTGPRGRARGR